MPDTTIQTYTVPMVSSQQAASNEAAVAILDNSLTYIQAALNDMSGRLAEAGSKNAIIRHGVPIGDGVYAGTLVYFNTETSLFEPAIAQLEALPGANGASIEAPSARVEGLILRIDNSEATGTMLCGGYYEDANVAQNCLGENAEAGTYYLSPYTAGKATTDTDGLLRQPVLSYYGDGKFSLSLFYLAHDNHYHTTAILQSDWTAVPADAEDIPEGALWYYDGSLLASAYVGVLSPITTAVFWNGILQPVLDDPTDGVDTNQVFAIYKGVLYSRSAAAPAAGSVTIFNHFPFAYNSSVVRSIQSTNENMLKVEDANGVVTLTPYDFVGAGSTPSAAAVASIVGGTVSYTPVVPGVAAGPGMTVTRALNGVTTISLSSMVGDPIDAYSIQHNGSTLITDGVLQFITFPANRTSEFVMFLPVTDVPEGVVLQASAWGTLYGPQTSLVMNGYFIEQPSAGNNTVLPNTADLSNASTVSFAGQSGELSYAEIALTGCTITAPGMLVARVRPASTPSRDIQLLRVGFKLNIAETSSTTATEPTDNGGMVTGELVAAEAIAAGQAVYINASGQLAVCRANNAANAGLCVGVAFNGGSVGTAITYVISGVTQASAGATLTPGKPVYINTDGTLINLSTSAEVETFYESNEFLHRIGTAVTSNLVQVHIESAITKGE